ncbi:MAG: hypothetical protein V2B19_09245, partial [Pseudomonadota bacterium]
MHRMPLKKTILGSVIILAIAAVVISVLRREPLVPEPVYTIPRQIRYAFTLQNTSNSLLKKAQFWTYAPVKKTPTQHCVNIETSHSHELIMDNLGNQILLFVLENFPPYACRVITVKADLMLAQEPNPVRIEDLKPFLGSERYIESDHVKLVTLAQTLKTPDSAETAENIFQWVANHVTYSGF